MAFAVKKMLTGSLLGKECNPLCATKWISKVLNFELPSRVRNSLLEMFFLSIFKSVFSNSGGVEFSSS